jgi:hypothetical protein
MILLWRNLARSDFTKVSFRIFFCLICSYSSWLAWWKLLLTPSIIFLFYSRFFMLREYLTFNYWSCLFWLFLFISLSNWAYCLTMVKKWLFFSRFKLDILYLDICLLRTRCRLCYSRSLSCYNFSLLMARKTVGSVVSALLLKEVDPEEWLSIVLWV